MKTIIEFKDGHSEVKDDLCPSFDLTEFSDETGADIPTVCCIDVEGNVMTDDVPLNLIKRVVFEV